MQYILPNFLDSFSLDYYNKFTVVKKNNLFDHSNSENIYVFIGVSGVGKTTVLKKILSLLDKEVVFIKRTTTRDKRKKDYFMKFVSNNDFSDLEKDKKFFYTHIYEANGKKYGILLKDLEKIKKNNCLFFIEDTPSLVLFKKFFPKSKIVLLLPPSKSFLEKNFGEYSGKKDLSARLEQSILETETIKNNLNRMYDNKIVDHSIIIDNNTEKKVIRIINNNDSFYEHKKWFF